MYSADYSADHSAVRHRLRSGQIRNRNRNRSGYTSHTLTSYKATVAVAGCCFTTASLWQMWRSQKLQHHAIHSLARSVPQLHDNRPSLACLVTFRLPAYQAASAPLSHICLPISVSKHLKAYSDSEYWPHARPSLPLADPKAPCAACRNGRASCA
jgi:hypothetical protein